MSSTTHLLHGLWLPGSGLNLWLERVEGHRVLGALDDASREALPAAALAALSSVPRGRPEVELRTPKGRTVRHVLPTWAFVPERAVTVLESLRGDVDDVAIAADLRFLVRVQESLERWARAGRALVAVTWEDGQWWPQWRLPDGLKETSWRAQVAQRTPPVLMVNGGGGMLDDLVGRLFHWTVNALLSDLPEPPKGRQAFVRALLDSEPLRRATPDVATDLAQWRASATGEDVRLLLVLEEPEDFDDPDHGRVIDIVKRRGRSGAEGEGADGAAEPLWWPLRMHYRIGVDAPERLDPAMCRGSVLTQLRPQLEVAQHAFPVFRDAMSDGDGLDLLLSPEQVVELVARGVDALRDVGIAVMLPRSWVAAEPTLRLEVDPREMQPVGSVRGATESRVGFDQIVDYTWRLTLGDEVLSDDDIRRLSESGSGLVKLRDTWVAADPVATRKALKFLEEQTKAGEATGKGSAALKELHFSEGAVSQAPVPVDVDARGWARSLYGAGGEDHVADAAGKAGDDGEGESIADGAFQRPRVPTPRGFVGQLREYQRRGLDWLAWMSDAGFGVILADDMGLGKTVQILALLLHEKETRLSAESGCLRDGEDVVKHWPTLLVAPLSVVSNWANEARKFAPGLKVEVLHGGNRPRGEELKRVAENADLVVTTYGIVARDPGEWAAVEWDHVILDEAQAVKNPNTAAAKAVRLLPARQRIALTGTPVENNLGELRAIMDFCNRNILGSARSFRSRFAAPIERDGDVEVAAELRAITAPFILRRMKTDPGILDDLPEKDESVTLVPLTAEQALLYKGWVEDLEREVEAAKGMKRRALVLQGITKLKQICNHPAHFQSDGSPLLNRGRHRSGKVAELERIVDQAVLADERVLVFTQYTAFGRMLQPWLSERLGREIPFLHGGVSRAERARMVDEFNHEDGAPVMVLSLKAGGTGLNLTAANHVVHVDRWWNPAVEDQATDRAYRIGQRRDVRVHKLVAKGTIEERIDQVIAGKVDLARAVMPTGEAWLTELGLDELHRLWRLDDARSREAERAARAGHVKEEDRDGRR
ncbi:DEAD/DEAH box helicase [Corynebacterium freneyi]|uniref:Superfamily II DNA or RNA helicase n=1 Tax=Corynebacterium freneyi TaxID=134034 RepID=A0ABS4U8G9_9CORY|nr:DEAD/DEAH box helicase [Corynebacterium freneyi]MBP2332958.1 superfamily II DNA or RNA helicase [Corynebacterium freneyi]QXA52932.1 DEAD/DEAH box helicase [Corynebacterium freneyi]WJZ04938.1 RNA polymerase-associated protein RapA [Corynebacterium freneyi]